jgi:hypothetical protein
MAQFVHRQLSVTPPHSSKTRAANKPRIMQACSVLIEARPNSLIGRSKSKLEEAKVMSFLYVNHFDDFTSVVSILRA